MPHVGAVDGDERRGDWRLEIGGWRLGGHEGWGLGRLKIGGSFNDEQGTRNCFLAGVMFGE